MKESTAAGLNGLILILGGVAGAIFLDRGGWIIALVGVAWLSLAQAFLEIERLKRK